MGAPAGVSRVTGGTEHEGRARALADYRPYRPLNTSCPLNLSIFGGCVRLPSPSLSISLIDVVLDQKLASTHTLRFLTWPPLPQQEVPELL